MSGRPRGLRAPVIFLLRKAHPGAWTFDPKTYEWRHESGRVVVACAQLAPQYDGDDDSFTTTWRWQDTGEQAIDASRVWRRRAGHVVDLGDRKHVD